MNLVSSKIRYKMEQVCPQCKMSSYQKPQMKLMINECGHKMCENCMNTIFTRPTAPCPECGQALKKSDYRERQFDDIYIERDVNIRKEILKDFNKREEDFDQLEEYNDYLERVEELIFKRVNNINTTETIGEIERFVVRYFVFSCK